MRKDTEDREVNEEMGAGGLAGIIRSKKFLRYAGIGLAVVLLMTAVVIFAVVHERNKDYQLKADTMTELQVNTREAEEQTTPDPVYSDSFYETNNLDFAKLKESNSDIYAWVEVPGTSVDYPVLQHATDDSYYLEHNMDGSKGYPGCIYSENINSLFFTDRNTVLYGHNMKNGTMFASLHEYEDPVFFEENPYIYIYAQDGRKLTYRIFAAYRTDDAHLLKSIDISNDEKFEAYIGSIYEHNSINDNYDTDVKVDAKSKILTLSTCNNDNKGRYLVQGVLVENAQED